MSRTRCSVLHAAPQSRDPKITGAESMDPGPAAHRFALRSIRGTPHLMVRSAATPRVSNHDARDATTIRLDLCHGRAAQILSERAVGQRFGQMQPADFFRAVEIGQRAGDAQDAVIAARRQPHGFGGVAQQF